jgi:hypothetical protein
MPEISGKTPFDEFMLSEYATIASAHFDLHAGLRQTFRFYLGLLAVPFSVWAVAFKDHTDIFHLPSVLAVLFGIMPLLGFMMFLQMVHTRFDIILYTRAVNGVRAYFVSRAFDVKDVVQYLKLPRSQAVPPYREGPSRAYWWQFLLMSCINTFFLFILTRNVAGWWWTLSASALCFGVHPLAYVMLSRQRERREILGTDEV